MSFLENLKTSQKTCIVQDGRRKIHFIFKDKTELAEEYDLKTDVLLVRKWKKSGRLGGEGKWQFEVGEDLSPGSSLTEGLMESSTNPVFVRKDGKDVFQWRIRNLPYPLETYNVTVDNEQRTAIIRTTNKKYYKKFTIDDLDRHNLPLEQERIVLSHSNNTLIIKYKKPTEILQHEKCMQDEFKKMKDGDVGCNPS
ncbi:unnamed protein product [Owenia fusiformis]|uniref:Protein DPCD n=1 Tax=Owenia fusiformis TaxID=6347 RepID=A0A8J1T7K1_OWEFU|nr:unnamed protein product [Owenia fusiformis]